MPVLALGLSYRRARVELLERAAFGKEEFSKAYHHLTRTDGVRGGVIVSTCNRIEVFGEVEAYHAGFQALKSFLEESRDLSDAELSEPLYSHYEEQAAEHLFSVAAGLDSMVLGEPQILSQVRKAYKTAEAEGAAGPLLQALFHRAIRAGRRVRTETEVGSSPAAFLQAAAELAERARGPLAGKDVLIVGAGRMSELAVDLFAERGVGGITVLSRTPERARRVAARGRGRGGGLDQLAEGLARADLVISATGATGVVIERESLETAVAGGRALFVVDLAVPRDVDPAAAAVPGVRIANIDDLKEVVVGTDGAEVERAREVVGEEVARFTAWRRAAKIAPLIQALYDRGEAVRAVEFDRIRRRLEGLSEDQRAAVEAAMRGVVAKLLHTPVVRLKELGDPADTRTRFLAELFDVELPPPE